MALQETLADLKKATFFSKPSKGETAMHEFKTLWNTGVGEIHTHQTR